MLRLTLIWWALAGIWPAHPVLPPQPHSQTCIVEDGHHGHLPSHQASVHTTHTATTCPLPEPRGGVPLCPVFGQRRTDKPSEGPGNGLSPFGKRLPGFKYRELGLGRVHALGSADSSPTGGVQLEEAYSGSSKVQGPHWSSGR